MFPIIVHEKTITKPVERYINADYIFEIENRANVENGSIIYLSLIKVGMTGQGIGNKNYISYEVTERAEEIIKQIKKLNAGIK